MGRKRTLQPFRLAFLLAGSVERRYLLLESLRHRVLLSTVAVQAHEREEAVRLSVFRFAVREAGKPSKPSPVRRAGVSIIPLGQCLRGKGSEELRKDSRVLEPGLEVAGAGLDNSTWVEAVGREPRKRGLAEIVERSEQDAGTGLTDSAFSNTALRHLDVECVEGLRAKRRA